ncbi:MAG TPA: hypothetical protein VEB60_00945 [Candidatus Paceibacterota bacterium]|nr:hypothetical protein [Candidatus Paceibacterota bacterium]
MTNISGKHNHLRPKICISGAAETGHCGPDAMELAKELGREIARQGGVLVTGATTGFPLWSAMGCKEEGGVSLGLSPAASEREHIDVYKLPVEYQDLIIYTGFGYSGRNLLLTRSSDAVIVGCGRIGTLNEFTVAFEDGKPIGVLQGAWEFDELLQEIIEKGRRPNENILFDENPKNLVARLIDLIEKNKEKELQFYKNPDHSSGAVPVPDEYKAVM